MGEIAVPAERYWGAQTQRSLENFRIGGERMPLSLIHALALQKQAAAEANMALGALDKKRGQAIAAAAIEVSAGKHDSEFPLVVWQTGSGTQSADPSERSCQFRPVVERQLPHRHAYRRGAAG